ncbi:GDSL-type esterase/lipase family protein [Umezawaea sp.]|uniref:GDSL-type esterase/lipase family protein n=1 Tax=Umezawaea sp. TaxID=1955258 RepID=UPI002ED4495F
MDRLVVDVGSGVGAVRGVAEVRRDGGWVVPSRLPASAWPVDPELAEKARMAAGARVEFRTDATGLSWPVRTESPEDVRRPAPFDVVVDGVLHARCAVDGDGVVGTDLPPGEKVVRIWLPQFGFARLGALSLFGASTVVPVDPRPRWVLYGSSISQCTAAAGPSETWPALVAAEHDWDLRCLGFSGQCHLDPVVARFVRDGPADLIALCLGVNVHGRSSFTRRTFRPAVAGFLATVRDGHPDTPVVLITPITSPAREHAVNGAGMTLADVRGELVGIHDELRHVDPRLSLVHGPEVLGPAEADLLGDGLHPTAAGYRLMATRLAPHLAPRRRT